MAFRFAQVSTDICEFPPETMEGYRFRIPSIQVLFPSTSVAEREFILPLARRIQEDDEEIQIFPRGRIIASRILWRIINLIGGKNDAPVDEG